MQLEAFSTQHILGLNKHAVKSSSVLSSALLYSKQYFHTATDRRQKCGGRGEQFSAYSAYRTSAETKELYPLSGHKQLVFIDFPLLDWSHESRSH